MNLTYVYRISFQISMSKYFRCAESDASVVDRVSPNREVVYSNSSPFHNKMTGDLYYWCNLAFFERFPTLNPVGANNMFYDSLSHYKVSLR